MKSHCIKTINLLTNNDIDNLLIIADNLFGRGYLSKNELQRYIDDKTKTCIVVKINNEIVGFQLMQTIKPEEIASLALKEPQWFKKQFSSCNSIGVLKTIAVKDKFKNQGIGTLLTTESIKILNEKSNCILSICWDKKENTVISSILEKCGMIQVRKIPEFWKNDSIEKNYSCNICGEPPCTCNAIIYQSNHQNKPEDKKY